MRRLVCCEFCKAIYSNWSRILILATVLLIVLYFHAPTHGQLFMVAGEEPNLIGGAVGFFVKVIDSSNIGKSLIRSSFGYTVLWIPLTILLSLTAFSADFVNKSVIISRAKGAKVINLIWSKQIVIYCGISFGYLLCCIVSLAIEIYRRSLPIDENLLRTFFKYSAINLLLLLCLAAGTILIYLLCRSLFATAFSLVCFNGCVLMIYPAIYENYNNMPIVIKFLVEASPVYYLMHTCALATSSRYEVRTILYICLTFALDIIASAITYNCYGGK